MHVKEEYRHVCDVLRAANDAADWGRARALYEQGRHIRRSRAMPEDLRGELARCLADLAVSYRGREDLFVEHTLAVFAEVDDRETFDHELFVDHYRDRTGSVGRTPSLFETVVETGRRRRDARRVEQTLAGSKTSGILCGSVSYGPFYNVHGHCGDQSASDLDLIIVIEDVSQLSAVADGLSGLVGVDRADADRLHARAKIFTDHYDDGGTFLSHKISLWVDDVDELLPGSELRGDYQVSLHVLTRPTLGYVLVESSTQLTRAAAGGTRTVRDYRDTWTSRADLPRTFAGREHPVTPWMREVDEGWLRCTTAYLFDETDCYCPGFLQTILLPASELLWDEIDVRSDLATFARKFADRYRHERARNQHALLRPSFTHIRRDSFAPHIIERFDAGL